jgi:hypothetical protein
VLCAEQDSREEVVARGLAAEVRKCRYPLGEHVECRELLAFELTQDIDMQAIT